MIIYDLACDHNHRFEGWFQSKDNYESQNSNGMISCPHCASIEVHRVPSAVNLSKKFDSPASGKTNEAAVTNPISSVPSDVMAVYQDLVSILMQHSEDVGDEFANEARRIHYMAAPERAIYGQASQEEHEMLLEEGIEILRLPILRKKDMN